MLAETAQRPFSRSGWIFELKLDGYRVLAEKDGDDVRLLTRNGNDCGPSFPEVVRAVKGLPVERAVLDGEVVALDAEGRPSFQRLQGRAKLQRALDVRRATVDTPVTYCAFDLLAVEGHDLRPLPLLDRKALLRRLLPPAGIVRYVEHVERDGEALFEQVQAMGLEGLMAKRADAPYRGGRSAVWLKLRTRRREELRVVGFTAPRGRRGGIGALHLARDVDGELVYAGRVGTGFTDAQLIELRNRLEPRARKTPPCTGPLPKDRGTTWVEPELRCEVEYTEVTDEGLLRQPVLVRLTDGQTAGRPDGQAAGRPDARTVGRPDGPTVGDRGRGHPRGTGGAPPVWPSGRPTVRPSGRLTNLDKVFWPAEGYAKGDLIEYYRSIAPWLLPYLKDRPVVLTRYPDGIEGKSFYQKDAPPFTPEWVRTVKIWSDQTGRDIDYIVCDDIETLLYLANLGSIPLHVWASRVSSLDRPDWCVLDLDPKGAPFGDVVRVARAVHGLCERVELPHFVKTSGSSGLHVLIPLGRQLSHDECRAFGELLARVIVAELPDIATITRQVSRRGGKVYLDYLQNAWGQLIVAPFSVRPLPGAPVSTPLAWREVNSKLDIGRFTIRTVPARMKRATRDPMAPVLELAPDLGRALGRLTRDAG
ncbi:MAG TPA: DNA ligase D [Gemmatimonadales bacterium]|nr:DNA ligase D [Gemmatimonadales bacterium]